MGRLVDAGARDLRAAIGAPLPRQRSVSLRITALDRAGNRNDQQAHGAHRTVVAFPCAVMPSPPRAARSLGERPWSWASSTPRRTLLGRGRVPDSTPASRSRPSSCAPGRTSSTSAASRGSRCARRARRRRSRARRAAGAAHMHELNDASAVLGGTYKPPSPPRRSRPARASSTTSAACQTGAGGRLRGFRRGARAHAHALAAQQRLQDPGLYEDVVDDVMRFLHARMELARARGIRDEADILDPGLDFAKTPAQTIALLARRGGAARARAPAAPGRLAQGLRRRADRARTPTRAAGGNRSRRWASE